MRTLLARYEIDALTYDSPRPEDPVVTLQLGHRLFRSTVCWHAPNRTPAAWRIVKQPAIGRGEGFASATAGNLVRGSAVSSDRPDLIAARPIGLKVNARAVGGPRGHVVSVRSAGYFSCRSAVSADDIYIGISRSDRIESQPVSIGRPTRCPGGRPGKRSQLYGMAAVPIADPYLLITRAARHKRDPISFRRDGRTVIPARGGDERRRLTKTNGCGSFGESCSVARVNVRVFERSGVDQPGTFPGNRRVVGTFERRGKPPRDTAG